MIFHFLSKTRKIIDFSLQTRMIIDFSLFCFDYLFFNEVVWLVFDSFHVLKTAMLWLLPAGTASRQLRLRETVRRGRIPDHQLQQTLQGMLRLFQAPAGPIRQRVRQFDAHRRLHQATRHNHHHSGPDRHFKYKGTSLSWDGTWVETGAFPW